jgi:hypothetical protein
MGFGCDVRGAVLVVPAELLVAGAVVVGVVAVDAVVAGAVDVPSSATALGAVERSSATTIPAVPQAHRAAIVTPRFTTPV